MRVSVATDWIKPSLLTLSVQLQITSRLSACEASRMTLRGRDRRSLSVHSSSVRGQLVLPGPSLSQWCFRTTCLCFCTEPCDCHVSESMAKSHSGHLQITGCCLSDHVLGCPVLSSPVFFSALCLKMLASILSPLQLWYCPHRQYGSTVWSLYGNILVFWCACITRLCPSRGPILIWLRPSLNKWFVNEVTSVHCTFSLTTAICQLSQLHFWFMQ